MTLLNVIAVLDANVLYPAPVRDLLLSLAASKLFQPKWTRTIQGEWTRNLISNRPDINEEALGRSITAMNTAFPDAMVIRYGGIVESIELPDPNDRHVLAAAIRAEATHIVTANTKDFPKKYIASFGVNVLSPDEFIKMLISGSPGIAYNAFETMLLRLKKPPLSRKEVLAMLEKCGLRSSVTLLS